MGGMGEVWEGADLLLSRRVAVKILKDELRTTPAFIQRFRAEARHAASLAHPGIATVYDYGETAEVAYLVMELVPGQTLSELLVEQPDLPTATRLSILSQTAEALHAAHRAGVIHRDVKPANLIVGPNGTVKVTDFGIARAIGAASLTDAGQVFGTAHYMSPEQATGNQVTSASDIYSLGVVAYEMFAGRRPFEAETPLAVSTAHIHSPVPPLPPGVPEAVADLIRESLAKDPAARPASAEVFALRVRREMRDGLPAPTLTMPATATAVTTTPASAQPPPARTGSAVSDGTADPEGMRRPALAALLVFLGLVLLIAGGVWLFAATLGTDNSSEGSLGSDTTATADPPPSSTLATSAPPSTAPATVAPATAAPTTAAPTTAAPTTAAPTTAAPTTAAPTTAAPTTAAPAATAPASTSATVAATPTEPPAPTTTDTPITAAPVLTPNPGLGPTDADEALAFVLTYYEQVNGGEFDATWPKLTQEFRDARNLTFESYARYWRNTSLELGDLRYTPGPAPNEARVRFDARYDTFGRIVEETDELTLRREQDGRLVITEQRVVA